ncbi:hypothetical protein [Isoptericola sp. NPDC057391]|uniref:hypothetical protein n=1 Tax=Isoptericola sp. NPDC057391 TaxID=3346117 RepID=UPI003632106A
MKRILSTAVAAVIAVGLAVPVTATAAVPSNVVTSREFAKVAYGNSIQYVRSTFGTNGTVVDRIDVAGTRNDYVKVRFPTYYKDGTVEVEFLRRTSGTWYLVAKYASWGNSAKRTADKATSAEFGKVKQGNSITYTRQTFGTAGTVVETYEAPGTEHDAVVLEWPTESTDGWVQVYFVKNSSGTWKVDTRVAFWGEDAKRTADKATRAEFDRVAIGNSIDHVRRTFGTAGTIAYYFDAPGSSSDLVWLLWPTPSPDGFLNVDFAKTSAGTWKTVGRWAAWEEPAVATDDVATEAEFTQLRDRLANGQPVTLAMARSVLGSAGTIGYRADEAGTDLDQLGVAWYTGTEGAEVQLSFVVSGGTWTALTTDHIAGPWTARALRSAAPEATTGAGPVDRDAPERPTWEHHGLR